MTALVLLGADPLADFPDRRPGRAGPSSGADFVVAVADRARAPSLDHADVVLPAAEAHERPGTTTNIEGRISRLGQKLVPPGQAWPDWMIAGELAVHLGHDLGLRLGRRRCGTRSSGWPCPTAGITRAVLDAHGAADGVVAPLPPGRCRCPGGRPRSTRSPCPGVESVERQGASLQAGLAASPNAAAPSRRHRGRPAPRRRADPPGRAVGPADLDVPHVSPRRRLLGAPGGLPGPLRRRHRGRHRAVAGRPGGAGRAAGQPARPRRPGCGVRRAGAPALGHRHAGRSRSSPTRRCPARWWPPTSTCPLGDGTVADLIDRAFPVVDLRMETP